MLQYWYWRCWMQCCIRSAPPEFQHWRGICAEGGALRWTAYGCPACCTHWIAAAAAGWWCDAVSCGLADSNVISCGAVLWWLVLVVLVTAALFICVRVSYCKSIVHRIQKKGVNIGHMTLLVLQRHI